MEQLLIQATIMRAKRLARRLQDSRATSTGEEMKFPGLCLEFENDSNENSTNFCHGNQYKNGSNQQKSYLSSSHSSSTSLGRHSDPTLGTTTRPMGFFDLPHHVKGKILDFLAKLQSKDE